MGLVEWPLCTETHNFFFGLWLVWWTFWVFVMLFISWIAKSLLINASMRMKLSSKASNEMVWTELLLKYLKNCSYSFYHVHFFHDFILLCHFLVTGTKKWYYLKNRFVNFEDMFWITIFFNSKFIFAFQGSNFKFFFN